MHQERILIRGLNWLGDAIMCLPALHRLREARPDAHITLLTPAKLAGLWTSPLIDSVLTFDKQDSLWRIARLLRRGRYSTALVLPTSLRSAIEVWLAGVPTRIGVDHRGRGALLSHCVPKPTGILEMKKRSDTEIRHLAAVSSRHAPAAPPARSHHVFRYLSLVTVLGANSEPLAPTLTLADDEMEQVLRRFALEPGAVNSPLYAMCPGGEYGRSKRWPEERFIETARILARKTGCRWLLLGAPGEAEACGRIADGLRETLADARLRNLAGKTSLRELAGLLKSCDLLLGNDSGPMHLAAAVGTPVAGIFSSTSAALTGPGLPGEQKHFLLTSTAPCSPCFLRECPIDMRCMNSLETAAVVNGIMALPSAAREPDERWQSLTG